MKMARKRKDRGYILVGVMATVTLFLIYATALSVRTSTERLSSERQRDRYQAMDLAQGSMEQLREDLYSFFLTQVYQLAWQADAVQAMAWLDSLDPNSGSAPNPAFLLTDIPGVATGPTPLSENNPRVSAFNNGTGSAWIVSVTNPGVDTNNDGILEPGPLTPRHVTFEATATTGMSTKRIRATYRFSLGPSDIFRYAYFLNNYGWIDARGGKQIKMTGEIRANGDFDFTSDSVVGGEATNIRVSGDIYASQNSEVINPVTGLPAAGLISGDPTQYLDWVDHWTLRSRRARPDRHLTEASQPAIGGIPTVLPTGQGWNSDSPQQQRFEQLPVQPLPYLGDLALYTDMAGQYSGGSGSTLTYRVANADGSLSSQSNTINSVYDVSKGPNGIAGDADDGRPLVLIGKTNNPIVINGPVVVPGDVVIRGVVTGRGTIYAGRNVHIIGSVTYLDRPFWSAIQREATTGQLRETGQQSGPKSNLGTVCNNGTYVAPGGSVPAGCM